ncbi:hypothetical protein [Arthrobacter sp. MYb213]|uniref:hypothetical protein n=1 Tax=Arthrobacter sp. MYb213 TaxID=1848595 RepID=UPI000CFAF96C|nr:hypothetical protein [Arthrobacter sp. MYb213]PRB69503.1 hypothetical protein CQ011_12130 [Arthrobacter sp. MYb213]
MIIGDIPLARLKEQLAKNIPLAFVTSESLIERLEVAEQELKDERVLTMAAATILHKVRALCMTTDGDYLDNEETVNTVGDILEALGVDGSKP